MGVSTEFKNVVENDSIIAVRSFLTNYLIGEDDFQLFDDALAYAADKVDVWQEHDGQEFSADKAAWTTDYLSELLVAVVSNFSRQRIDHIKAMLIHFHRFSDIQFGHYMCHCIGRIWHQQIGCTLHARI